MAARFALIALTAVTLAAAPPALAGPDRPEEPKGGPENGLSRLDEALDQAMAELKEAIRRLDRLFGEMPRYAMPEITEDGDIIIRRHPHPHAPDRPPPAPPPPSGSGPGGEGLIEL